jgi:hypothetical protein
MTYSPAALGGAALALLLAAAADLRAEMIHWSYNWSRSPTDITADSPGTGFISLSDEKLGTATGDSDIVATNLLTHSTADTDNPDHFTAKAYTLGLFLLDKASGQSATLYFTGHLDGTLTQQSANITNTFTGKLTQSVQLGKNLYTATIGPYSSPGPPTATNAGTISAHAKITVLPVQTLPEPSTLALAGLALSAVALTRRGRVRLTWGS